MNKYNVWNKWGKLKTVMLGEGYDRNFFDGIKSLRVKNALQKIADETQEDLEYYESVLKDFGCTVLRPDIDRTDNILNYVDNEGKVSKALSNAAGIPMSPLQPRDSQFVAGNKLFYTGINKGIYQACERYNSIDSIKSFYIVNTDKRYWNKEKFQSIAGPDWGSYDDYKNDPNYYEKLKPSIRNEIKKLHSIGSNVAAPSFTVVGRDIFVDELDCQVTDDQLILLENNFPHLRLNRLRHGGHSDGCFHTLKPGAILSLKEIQIYKNTFPGWDVCYLPDQSWDKVKGFLKIKHRVGGKWWVPGEEDNDEFTYFVETWLQDWVGYVEETVFDVNVLVLDEHHVCVNNMNPTVIEFLKKHNMEPVHVPWRHRYFWDGGLHCITLDLEREGEQEDYFPERGDTGVIDYGFN